MNSFTQLALNGENSLHRTGGRSDGQTYMAVSSRLLVLIKNIYTYIYGSKHLAKYVANNKKNIPLIYPLQEYSYKDVSIYSIFS